MPKLHPAIIEMRMSVCQIVEKLVRSGKFLTEKSAFLHVISISRKTQTATGFTADDELISWSQFKSFKSRNKFNLS